VMGVDVLKFFPRIPAESRISPCLLEIDSTRYSSGMLGSMPRKSRTDARGDMLQGTLDMLILRTLVAGPAHGHTVAHVIEKSSDDILQVEHGSLYPALHRLEDLGLIASFWGTSENNRKAKYYRITPDGRRHLLSERSRWSLLVSAVTRVLGPATE
jgi:PadR family transcriptional regulator